MTFPLLCCRARLTSAARQLRWYMAPRAITSIVLTDRTQDRSLQLLYMPPLNQPRWSVPSKRNILEHFCYLENTRLQLLCPLNSNMLSSLALFGSVEFDKISLKRHSDFRMSEQFDKRSRCCKNMQRKGSNRFMQIWFLAGKIPLLYPGCQRFFFLVGGRQNWAAKLLASEKTSGIQGTSTQEKITIK